MTLDPFRRSAGLLDRSDRSKLRFTGDQDRWFLDQLVTNDVQSLEPGSGQDALLLTPNGRIVAVLRLACTGRGVFADTDPGRGAELSEFFDGRVFATRVEVADVTGAFGMLTVLGPRAGEVVGRALGGGSLPEEEHASGHAGPAAPVRVTRPAPGFDLWVPREQTTEVQAALVDAGGEVVTAHDYAALCAAEGLPRFGVDFDDHYLPQEAAYERAVHFKKGCYLGQEAVAMAQRGRVKRRLRHLRFEGEAFPGVVLHDGADAGRVTSAGEGFGIATVRTSVPVGSGVEVAGPDGATARAEVRELPGTLEGPKAPSARELREQIAGAAAPPRRSRP